MSSEARFLFSFSFFLFFFLTAVFLAMNFVDLKWVVKVEYKTVCWHTKVCPPLCSTTTVINIIIGVLSTIGGAKTNTAVTLLLLSRVQKEDCCYYNTVSLAIARFLLSLYYCLFLRQLFEKVWRHSVAIVTSLETMVQPFKIRISVFRSFGE